VRGGVPRPFGWQDHDWIRRQFVEASSSIMDNSPMKFLLALLLPAFTTTLHAAAPSTPLPKPNILFIIADDLNNDLGCYGNPDVQSPNIDLLARRGVRFDHAYCQYPQCNPSRTSFLTGLRPDSTHVFNNDVNPRQALPNALYLPNYFKKQGYFTATLGKVTHYPGLLESDVAARIVGGKAVKQAAKEADRNANDETTPDGQSARYAVELIEQHKDRPFLIAVGFHRPHVPLTAPQKYFTYDAAKLTLASPPPGYPKGVPAAALDTSRGSAGGDAARRKTVADYYACISFVDAQIGLLMGALDRLKLWDNTIVVLIGDHGWLHGEHGGEGKQSLFEPSARAPLIVVAPGRKVGAASTRLVEFVDIFPSLAELCGFSDIPKNLEGTSFVPLLDDPMHEWKKAAFTVTARSDTGRAKRNRDPKTDVLARSVRTERYVFNDWGDGKSFELYDHQSDPGEYVNRAADPNYASLVKEMSALLKAGWEAARPPVR
jgi:iduronate 2-sulfatase